MLLKTIGIIGDIHAEDKSLINVITFFKSIGVDAIYCTGDLCDGYGCTENVIENLKKSSIQSVKGNHDLWCITGEMRELPGAIHSRNLSSSSIEFLKKLPFSITLNTSFGTVILCHGIIHNVMGRVNDYDSENSLEMNYAFQEFVKGSYPSIMINGHSHKRMIKTISGKTIINAGTLFRDHNPCACFIDCVNRSVNYYQIVNDHVDSCSVEKVFF